MYSMKKWTCPRDFSIPLDDQERREHSYVVLGRNRDSDVADVVNYQIALERLSKKEEELGGSQGEFPWVWDDRDSHWLCGWIEIVYVDQNAPEELLQEAQNIRDSLEDYPILDEDAYSDAVSDAVYSYWENASDREKVRMIVDECEVTEEEAEGMVERQEFPEGVRDTLYDWEW